VPFPDDLITPTLKVKRNVAGKHFKDIIDELYGQPVKSKDKRTSKVSNLTFWLALAWVM
jgi:hypothetical protein